MAEVFVPAGGPSKEQSEEDFNEWYYRLMDAWARKRAWSSLDAFLLINRFDPDSPPVATVNLKDIKPTSIYINNKDAISIYDSFRKSSIFNIDEEFVIEPLAYLEHVESQGIQPPTIFSQVIRSVHAENAHQNSFSFRNGYCHIVYNGMKNSIKHKKGLIAIAILLSNPNKSISISELDEAMTPNKKTYDNSTKTQDRVSKNIKRAIEDIDSVLPTLYRHLMASIKTGRHCIYKPEESTLWNVDIEKSY
ncbi:MAG: hypothetical protein ABW082_13870 [Sedimenticola sp.]